MKRRNYLGAMAMGGLACAMPFGASAELLAAFPVSDDWKTLCSDLLKEWCDGMLRIQINKPLDPLVHGSLDCPSCDHIHGRCMDAVYPFLYMADVTGDKKYLKAGMDALQWAENNVSQEDGSWTVIRNPKSWKGISVFGAIALAEALKHHGHILDEEVRENWMKRLGRVAEYLYKKFTMTFTNVNYGYSCVYAMFLIGEVLENSKYTDRSKEMAKEIKDFLTEPNHLLFGEGKPSNKKSAKGLYPVDLGYNVEESLNNVVLYALHADDKELQELLTKSLASHLEFMLPDGAWDNSWGTRQAKWSYWGSRTTDGCQQAYGLLADRNPAFGTAAYMSTHLLKRCTKDGLLYGGLHYMSRGVPPCVHHTFAHAKSLAAMLDAEHAPAINHKTPLPRRQADGVKHFPEVDVWLAARGPWRATVSSYDAVYKEHVQQATGGSLAVLWNDTLEETLFAASMAEYILVEKNNCQHNPDGEDYALTPRLETYKDNKWYTNLYDLKAKVSVTDQDSKIYFDSEVHLVDRERDEPMSGGLTYTLGYKIEADRVTITAKQKTKESNELKTLLALPLVSMVNEKVRMVSPKRIEIEKEKGTVCIESDVPLKIKKTKRGRVFNLVPGFEAVPVVVEVPQQGCNVEISVLQNV